MAKIKTKAGKLFAAALLAAACITVYPSALSAAYAAGVSSGPAADTYSGPPPVGPGLQIQNDAGRSAENRQQQGQDQAGATQQQPQQGQDQAGATEQPQQGQEQAGATPQQPDNKDGLIFSGGRYIDPSKPMIALTFDDGPYAPVGDKIMDCLEKYNGRSTFFVVGNRVSSFKTEIQRMHDDGHEIGNHTYEHKYLTKLSAAEIRSQIDRCNQEVAAVTGASPVLVRLPGGLKNQTVMENVKFPIIMWDIDTQDWKTRNTQKTVNAVLGKVHDGDIVLMHELYKSTGDAVETIIPALVNQGYQLVTVSELASLRGGVQAGKTYNKFRPQ